MSRKLLTYAPPSPVVFLPCCFFVPHAVPFSRLSYSEQILRFASEGKWLAAICAAPGVVLGQLGVLDGKKAACYPGFEAQMTGAEVSMDSVVADGKIITSRGPGTAHLFAYKIVELLKSADTALALKSRVCLWEGTFRKYHTEFNLSGADALLDLSIAASTELIDNSGYTIYSTGNPSTDYRDLFASMSPQAGEIILARSFSDALAIRHNVNYYTIAASYGRPGLEKRFIDRTLRHFWK